MQTNNKQKVTFSLDPEAVQTLKDPQKVYSFKSASAVLDEAIRSYKQQKKLKKWKKGYEIAKNDSEILATELDLAESGDLKYYE